MDKVKIGLIGVGWIGSHHGHNVLKNAQAELVALANPECDRDKVDAFVAREHVSPRCYPDYQQLLADDEVDAVIIASPNGAHAEQAIAAAQAGKHIYLEKPMALTLEDCRRIVAAVKGAGVKFLIGYHRRFNPLYQHAKKLVADGYLGDVFFVESDYLHHIPGDWNIWSWIGKESTGGSLFHAGGGHNVDLIRFFGGEITEVSCVKDVYLPRTAQVETEDTAIATFRFANGVMGKVMMCAGPILPFTFKFSLFGTKGTLIDNRLWLDSAPQFYEPGHEKDYLTLPESWIPDNVQGSIGEPWDKSMDHFIDAVANDTPTINDVDSAYRTSEACFAAVLAAREKRVVTLPL
jgi:predicted dehydrogenase